MNRRTLGVGILLVWVALLGWLAKRELFRPRAEILAEAALSVPPGATYYRLDLGGTQIGFDFCPYFTILIYMAKCSYFEEA